MKQVQSLKLEIEELPEGKLLCIKNGKYTKWMQSNGKEIVYIPKEDRQLAEALAAKYLYILELDDLLWEYKLLEQCINRYDKRRVKSAMLIENCSRYQELINSHLQSFQNKSADWANADYATNTSHPEHLIHKTLAGHYVRSKSEVIIANALFNNEIPYRYECQLCLPEIEIYSDFTICHPQNHRIYYWEHFGMMDHSVYRNNAFNKLKVYGDNNILPSINLITTYETQTIPLNSNEIQQIIQNYFKV
ncbi:MAG TPA: hypothetical protein VJY54_12355 [Lachnospiraceae bacterium]|nr:hypothetical protein [Lachnospiraceae bacterium]